MLFASAFALFSLILGFIISLDDINPFRPKPLPMLQQIEMYRTDDGGDGSEDDLPLAA